MGSSAAGSEKYGYGSAAVAVITVTAFLGIGLVRVVPKRKWQYVSDFLLAVGAATLLCDSFLHLIPHGLGMHGSHEMETGEQPILAITNEQEDHDDHDEDHDHEGHSHRKKREGDEDEHGHGDEWTTILWKLNSMIFCFYAMWIYTIISQLYGGGHSHGDEPDDRVQHSMDQLEVEPPPDPGLSILTIATLFKEAPPKIYPIMIGDCIHNFADGLAIAVGFSEGPALGIGTSIAVLFHELPHELADFALYYKYTKSGVKALLFNVISAFFCFIGMFIGFAITSSGEKSVEGWLLMIVAGSFIFIAVIQVLPELDLTKDKSIDRSTFWKRFAVINFGLIFGWLLMYLIAHFEESIKNILT